MTGVTDYLATIQERAAHGSSACPSDEAWQDAQRDRRWLLNDRKRLVDFTWEQQARLDDVSARLREAQERLGIRADKIMAAERERDSWKRESELNAEAANQSADYAARLAITLELLRQHGIHVEEKWCWCEPTVEDHREGK